MAEPSGRTPAPRTTFRCAIYTRKSTEEGLDREFNSLDAQREACAAYILSQRHEGWTLLPDTYDDGGYSGGNMQRPGLRALLAEVEAGRVDVIVVYKVDRLTRALSDFAKIVDVLDGAGASFVSITQSFNTTTSMGRLTLNVLLSFAQFEREVISERVRDKVAASKRKGMWMGGTVPLGYDVVARKLVPNEVEAEIVRHIMHRYLEVGTVVDLREALEREGIRSKQNWANGKGRGGGPFGRGALYCLLANRLYRGEVHHKGEYFPGEHAAIVELELWHAVQKQLADNRVNRRLRTNALDASLLVGRVRDAQGRRMTPSHARKGSVRYRYYGSVNENERVPSPGAQRVAAGDLEPMVIAALHGLFSDHSALVALLTAGSANAKAARVIAREAKTLADELKGMSPRDQRRLVEQLDVQVGVEGVQLSASISKPGLALQLRADTNRLDQGRHELPIVSPIRRRSHGLRLIVSTSGCREQPNGRLLMLLIKAADARDQIMGARPSIPAASEDRHLRRLVRLAFLAPDIVTAILDGTQPPLLTARQLLRASEVPLSWSEQRGIFGFA